MTKFKDLSEEDKYFANEVSKKWINIISGFALFGIGLWMLLTPEGLEHASVEKSTVYIVKEIWSFEAGIFFLFLGASVMLLTFLKIKSLNKYAWVKLDSGYYLYKNKRRTSGNPSIYDQEDLLVFVKEPKQIVRMKKYMSSGINKLQKGLIEQIEFSNAYWNADSEGYVLFVNGEHLLNTSSVRENGDLIVKNNENEKQYILSNYDNCLDNKFRKATEKKRYN